MAMGRSEQKAKEMPPLTLAGRLVLAPVFFYRYFISPLLGVNCRYSPSCSEYAVDAIKLHGAWKGGYLAARRMARCHPFGGSGFDPVPKKEDKGHDPK